MLDSPQTPRTAQLIQIASAIECLFPAFEELAARLPDSIVETVYRLAGFPVLVRVAGQQLAADIDKSLHYVRTQEDCEPALTIEVWDDAEIGPIGLFSWPDDADYHGLVSVTDDARYALNQRPSSVFLLDRHKNRIVGGVRGREMLFQDERARPFHRLVSIWLDDNNIQFIHAGLVAQGNKGLLFAGKSGAGKTTSTLACYLGGFTYLSDDCVALEAAPNGAFVGHCFYGTCMHDNIDRFPTLARIAHPPNHSFETKDSVYLVDHDTGRFVHRVKIAAVVIPKVVDRLHTSYRHAKTMDAMLALAPSSLWILPNSARNSLAKLGGLVTTVPAYWLETGRDLDGIAPVVDRLCDELA